MQYNQIQDGFNKDLNSFILKFLIETKITFYQCETC